MKVKITFITPALGTLAGDPKLATDFIASKHPSGEIQPDEREVIANLDEAVEKTSTLFPRLKDGTPFIWDYQVLGFLKESCAAFHIANYYTKEALKKIRLTPYLFKKTIDLTVFVSPRQSPIELPQGCNAEELDFFERPLRATTMRGERICLARSEIVPEGSFFTTCIEPMDDKLLPYIEDWLKYGEKHGFLQWRSGGFGRFTFTRID